MEVENERGVQSADSATFRSNVQDVGDKTEKRYSDLLALSRVSAAVSGLQDLDAILEVALDTVLDIFGGTIGGILLIDEQTQTLSYRVYRGLSARYAEEMHLGLGEGIAGKVAQSGKAILLEDISTDPRAARPVLISTEGLKAFISVPLRARDAVLGVLNVASRMPRHFTKNEMHLLHSIGDQVGVAIEHARLYERLHEGRERYRRLAREILMAQEEERRRIARELHDETSQALTSLALSLQAIIGMAEMKGIQDPEFIEKLRVTHSYAVRAGNDVVRLMRELRPSLLDELGLPAAINRYAKDTLQAQGINVSMEFTGAEEQLPLEVGVTLFRVAQGAIGNILEHSAAKNTSIKLQCNARECLLSIEDDGTGFDVGKMTQVDPSGRGAGLFAMKERVRLVGGACRVESQPGQGTKVIVKVPLETDIADEEDKSANSG